MTRIYTQQGRRRHHHPVVRGPGREDGPANGGLRLDRRGGRGARRRSLALRPGTTPSWPPTSSACSASCSSPAPSWPRRPRPQGRLEDGVSRVDRRDGRCARAHHRPLHGPGRASPEVRDRRRHPALRPSSTSPAPPSAAPSAAWWRSRTPTAWHRRRRPPLPQPSLRPGLRDGAGRRRGRPGAVRGTRRRGRRWLRVVARRRQGYTHEVEIEGGHTARDRRAPEAGGADQGPSPTRTARGRARRLHRDHDRDVRGPQGLGARRRRGARSRWSTAGQSSSRVLRGHPAISRARCPTTRQSGSA